MSDSFLISIVLQGITLGLSAALLPGPMQGYLINTTLTYGWRRTLFVVVTPLFVDTPLIIMVLVALETMARFVPIIVDGVRLLGGLFVLYLAWVAWKDFRAGATLTSAANQGPSAEATATATFTRGLLVNALSPGPYLFWTTVNGPLLKQSLDVSVGHAVSFLLAFYGTFLGLLVLISMGFDRLRHADQRITRWMVLVIGVLLALVGVKLVIDGVNGLWLG